jgi:hypothetical protein
VSGRKLRRVEWTQDPNVVVEKLGALMSLSVTPDAWLMIRGECRGNSRGLIALKGKGEVELIEIASTE